MSMGMRKFQEMVFTGRPFTADEMAECGFVNSVVPRDQLEAEVAQVRDGLRPEPLDRRRLHAEDVLRGHEAVPGRVHGQPHQRHARVDGRLRPARREGGPEHRRGHRPGSVQGGEGLRQPLPAGVAAQQEGPRGQTPNDLAALRRPRRRPLERHRRRVLHEAPGRRRRRGRQGRGARGRPAPVAGRPPGATIPEGDDGALFTFLSSSKQSVVADPDGPRTSSGCSALLAEADAVVWSPGSRLAGHPTLAPARARPDRAAPHVTSITPFGLEGPWADRPATEFTLQAWSGGIVGLGRGAPDRRAGVGRRPDRRVAERAPTPRSGRWCRGPARGRRPGELVDLSMLEVLALCLTYYPVTYADMVGRPVPQRAGRSSPPASRRRATGSSASASAPASSGSTSACWSATPSGPRTASSSPTAATSRPTSPRGWPSTRPPRSSSWPARSASRTHRSATAPPSRTPTTSRPAARSWPTPATASPSPTGPTASTRRSCGRRSRRPGSASTTPRVLAPDR